MMRQPLPLTGIGAASTVELYASGSAERYSCAGCQLAVDIERAIGEIDRRIGGKVQTR